GAPTSSRCTFGVIPSSGCGCIVGGAITNSSPRKTCCRGMFRTRRRMPEPATVLVVAPNWLGDAVMALPAVADIRRHFQSSRLIVAARSSVADLFRMVAGIEDVVAAEPAAVRRAEASVAILCPNSFASAWLTQRAGIPERWGYAADLRTVLLTRKVRKPRTSLHQGGYYQHLVRELGIATGPLEPALSISPASLDD